jgi:hypothetical protein
MAGFVAAVVIALLRLGGVTAWPSHTIALTLLVVGVAPPAAVLVAGALRDGPAFGPFGYFLTDFWWW